MLLPSNIPIDGKSYSIDELELEHFSDQNLSTFEKDTLLFCKQWLSNQETFIIHTSGSTGTPKPIEVFRKQMQASACMTINALGLTTGDKVLICLNTAYIAGKMMLVRAFESAMDIVAVTPKANPLENFSSDDHFDFTALVPMQLETILDSGSTGIAILNNMKAVIIGGAPVSYTLQQRILKTLTVPVYSTYGMTETVSHIALKRLNGPKKSDYYQAFEGVQLNIDDRGCLTIKSVLTNNTTLITNDLVRLHNAKQFEWLGRIDHVINSGGIKVQTESVEKAVEKAFYTLAVTRRFFVTGLPDDTLGECIALCIEGNAFDIPFREELSKQISLFSKKYESPKQIFFIAEFIETATGKIDRRQTLAQPSSN